uniref:Uncharacterized protein n=1 Tax=Arundo donax TaxID=35708 RepID=A0A0A9H8W9_ARUDO
MPHANITNALQSLLTRSSIYHLLCRNKYMKQNRARDGKDAAARASVLESSGPRSGLPVPGGDRDVGVLGMPGDPD